MSFLQILILAVVQGAAELLPVSSSAHVIVAEKLMGLDPTSAQMTLLLVMLHTGTMFAVIVYFWSSWRQTYFTSKHDARAKGAQLLLGTVATGFVGLILLQLIKRTVAHGDPGFEIEQLFGNAHLMAGSLVAAGLLILISSRLDRPPGDESISTRSAVLIGCVQGLCLPFRGFSRSGATISTGLALGIARRRAEEFSFALAVVLTPAVIAKEGWRLYRANPAVESSGVSSLAVVIGQSALGMTLSFITGLVALRLLSSWLERGRWYWFGIYCLLAACVVLAVG
jgi:undecaprenyl-diphosphatase